MTVVKVILVTIKADIIAVIKKYIINKDIITKGKCLNSGTCL